MKNKENKENKQNVILADCEMDELKLFIEGLEKTTKEKFEFRNAICNGKRNIFTNIYRYLVYIFYPIKFFINAKKYNTIVCWQQFFGLFFSFYCNLFKTKKKNTLIVCNFTYKEKKGLAKKIYKKIMSFCLKNDYIDYLLVLSAEYAKKIAEEFNISIDKLGVIPFGMDDVYEIYKKVPKVEYENYTLSIGRSNRDYDFLINVWKQMPSNEKLIIACDEYKVSEKLPENIIIRNDISFDIPYIANCKLIIIPIDDGNICSGDTVLLKSMSFYKTIVVTSPSTLSEMYIEDRKNGICLPKDEKVFKEELIKLLEDENKRKELGEHARKSFEENYSRYKMGIRIGEKYLTLKNKI